MDTDKRTVYEFGDFFVESGRRRLSRRNRGESGGGQPLALTAKAFDTLLYLIEHRGETLDKDTLLSAIWPGVIVEENSLTQNISTLRQVLGETRAENRYIATVPRKGYRFVGEVTERSALAGLGGTATPAAPIAADSKRSLRPVWMGAAAVLVLVAIGILILERGRGGLSAPPAIHTLAILPFKPLLTTERDESLELGMTESMIASLGARGGLTIRPLSSVRRYGSTEQDPLAAGRALHAESVLDGALQHQGDQLRVSVRLLRVADGRQLWAHQFDGNVSGIFGVQEQISAKVAEILSARLTAAEGTLPTLGGTKDSTAYLLYANGRYALARSTEPSLVLAIGYFEKAIERDPQFALAHVGLADCYFFLGVFGMRPPSRLENDRMPQTSATILGAILTSLS